MRVLGYVRVSTEDQAREGISIAAQQAKIEAYATVKDWTLLEIVRDEGVSAKSLKRPGLQHLLAMVNAGQVDVVVIAKLDRLSRRVRDVYDLIDLFERKGVALVSLQESLDATTACGRAMIGLLAVMSQLERELIGERTADAMQHLKVQGRVYSRPVFTDMVIVTRMQQEHDQGVSYHGIADGLNADHVPTARGGQWRANTVRQLLLRVYQGQQRRVA